LALPPQTNEAFLREVDEQVRLDSVARFWKSWGRALVASLVAVLVALGGYLWWQNNREVAAGVESSFNLLVAQRGDASEIGGA
jgi:hypothetical protein